MTLPEPVSLDLEEARRIAPRRLVAAARPLRVVALAGAGGPLADMLQHRFGGRGSLAGHALGNLVLAALTEMHGDFLQAIRSASRLLDTRGTVLPSTLDEVQLVAELEDGRRVVGERHLVRAGTRVRRVFIDIISSDVPYYSLREGVKPGITGWAQIRYPYGASVEDGRNKLEFDLYYVQHQSLFLDLAICFHTVKTVLFGRGAR